MFFKRIFIFTLFFAQWLDASEAHREAEFLEQSDLRGMRKQGFEESGWRWVNDGFCLSPDRKHIDLLTKQIYTDFELSFEWALGEGANSGVKFWINESYGAVGFEFQLLDNGVHPDGRLATHRLGDLYDILSSKEVIDFSPDTWKTARLRVRGGTVEHWVEDSLVLSYHIGSEVFKTAFEDSKFRKRPELLKRKAGHVLFQDHGDPVCFRKVAIRRL